MCACAPLHNYNKFLGCSNNIDIHLWNYSAKHNYYSLCVSVCVCVWFGPIVPAMLAIDEGIALTRNENDNLILTCASDGIPRPDILWIRDGAVIEQKLLSRLSVSSTTPQPAFRTDIRGHLGLEWGSNSTLTITALTEADSGSYSCQTSNIEQVPPTRQNPPYQLTVERG